MAVCFSVAIFRHAGVTPVPIHVYLALVKEKKLYAMQCASTWWSIICCRPMRIFRVIHAWQLAERFGSMTISSLIYWSFKGLVFEGRAMRATRLVPILLLLGQVQLPPESNDFVPWLQIEVHWLFPHKGWHSQMNLTPSTQPHHVLRWNSAQVAQIFRKAFAWVDSKGRSLMCLGEPMKNKIGPEFYLGT